MAHTLRVRKEQLETVLLYLESIGQREDESFAGSSVPSDQLLDCSSVQIRMTDQEVEHPTGGRRRRYKSPSVMHDASSLPVPRLADHLDVLRMVPQAMNVKRKRSARDLSLLHPSLPQADYRTNMMRLWESLKWILGKLKGLKRV